MKNIKKLLLALLIVATATFTAFAEMKPVKYVFLFIGDGMSIPQRMMAERYMQLSGQGGLAINAMKNQAITYTNSASSFITDSAASGTAIACGEKTRNGTIGLNAKGEKIESIAYVAQKAGKKVGIITSVTINHATPASFYGHNQSRSNYYNLGLDMIESGFDYFAGGGVNKNDDKKNKEYKGDIYDLAKKAGYKVFVEIDNDDFKKLNSKSGKIMAFGSKEDIPYAIDADDDDLILADYVRKGIEVLDNPNGFFILAEGGKIDWMCHANDAATVIKEVIDFDKAVKVALEFAKKHPDETLIVITGDHETGGLTLGFAGTGYTSYIDRLSLQKCSINVFVKKISEMRKELRKDGKRLYFKDVKPLIEEKFSLKFSGDEKHPMYVSEEDQEKLKKAFIEKKSFGRALTHLFDNKAGVAWTSGAHTALPVNTTATGKGAENFNGAIDNTDIAKLLKQAVK
ncbi:MAG: alkaline phosphatase [Opitutales bacterium]|nr:alkaline phosphatase [Opitutales bacterium]